MKTDGISTIVVHACVNMNCTPVFEYEPLDQTYQFGIMHWQGAVGEFKFEWPLMYMDREDMIGLRDAITTILTITEGE